jgi:hypothetical protein
LRCTEISAALPPEQGISENTSRDSEGTDGQKNTEKLIGLF